MGRELLYLYRLHCSRGFIGTINSTSVRGVLQSAALDQVLYLDVRTDHKENTTSKWGEST